MGSRDDITDTNELLNSCENGFEFDMGSITFCADLSACPVSNNVEFSKSNSKEGPVQLVVPMPGDNGSRPLSLSEFVDIFYRNKHLGYCKELCYPLIDLSNSTKNLLLPALLH